MTQVYDSENGVATPVTVILAGPCRVLQLRSLDRDGYEAVQLGFDDKKRPSKGRRSRQSQASRAERGHVAEIKSKRAAKMAAKQIERSPKAGCEPQKFVRELRGETEGYEVGGDVTVSILEEVGC
ncbi:MAG: 50S ribosomal protein L3, partial [Planctomycetota bacterium]